ncbi:MAG: tripartite tricarboxylate transporter permease [Anaerolineae bacterium]|nr:tripartite tricarboxylate transporter permease [Anaerolineae bacterium]
MHPLQLIGYALVGTLLSAAVAWIPALHVYNVAGLLILAALRWPEVIPTDGLTMLMLGLVTGYATLNTIPSVFLAAPDESAIFIVLPGQKYLMQRRGYEATVLTGLGGLGGMACLLALAPFAGHVLPVLRRILQPHLHWILALIMVYMLLSEWPKGTDRAPTPWGRLWDGWRSLLAGIITFLLSGLLGVIIMYRSVVPLEVAFQNLMPAFAGLFAIPWVLTNLLSQAQVPPQHVARSVDASPALVARGVGAGVLGGLFAAFFPVVTGGIGGFLAGQATAQRDDRLFLLSQGASKAVYYVGGLLLWFVPGLHLTRGGMASMLSGLYTPYTPQTYWTAVGAMALSGALAFFLLLALARGAVALVERVDYRWISAVTLVLLVVLIVTLTGWGGLLVATAATGIGLLPVLWHSRRMNCMGVLLVPITLNMAGLGPVIARWLGLL